MGEPVTVLIVDDHPMMVQGIAEQLSLAPDVTVVGSAHSVDEAMALVASTDPTVIVSDLRFGQVEDGIRLIREVNAGPSRARVVLFSAHVGTSGTMTAVASGVAAVLSKDSSGTELIETIHLVARGMTVLPSWVTAPRAGPQLTEREVDVLALAMRGDTNRKIAEALGVGPETVKSHLDSVYTRLGVRNRTEAVRVAMDDASLRARIDERRD